MTTDEGDQFVAYQRVRIIRSTATALRCAITDKQVWLPREHVKGRLWSRGDCGTLLVRRWIALDRHLAVPAISSVVHLVCRGVPNRQPTRYLRLMPSV
jgi:hypothetical protein